MKRSESRMALRIAGIIFFCLLIALGGSGVRAQDAPTVSTLYVAKYGSDGGSNNCLNPAAPCQTIGYAVNLAGFDNILRVAQGTYVENINLDKPLHLDGGYSALGIAVPPSLMEQLSRNE